MDNNINKQDDGTLAFLNIPLDETNKHFNCPETTQQKLLNLSFWTVDFIDDIKTKFGEHRILVKIKFDEGSVPAGHEREEKFFTNSREIKYIISEIAKRKAFPRKVTLRASGSRYYFE